MTTTTTAATTGTTVGHNPNWIRAVVASLLLVILLKVGLGIPLMTTFIILVTIFVAQVVMVELAHGLAIAFLGVRYAGSMLIGLALFLTLRFIAAGVTGIYLVDSYNDPGGIRGMLTGRNISEVLMFEILFAFVAGSLAVTWKSKATQAILGGTFTMALIVLGFQSALPKYVESWGTRAQFDEKLVEKGGFVGVAIDATKNSLPSFSKPAAAGTTATVPTAPVATEAKEVLLFIEECYTPCSPSLDYKFSLDTQGDPITLVFPGIDEPVQYSGKGTIDVPTSRGIGPVSITSPDADKKARVKIWKVIMVR